jgi:hypothetical protein
MQKVIFVQSMFLLLKTCKIVFLRTVMEKQKFNCEAQLYVIITHNHQLTFTYYFWGHGKLGRCVIQLSKFLNHTLATHNQVDRFF